MSPCPADSKPMTSHVSEAITSPQPSFQLTTDPRATSQDQPNPPQLTHKLRISNKQLLSHIVLGQHLLSKNIEQASFTYIPRYLLKIHSSVVFRIFTDVCIHPHVNFRAFSSSKKDSQYPPAVPPLPLPQPLACTIYFLCLWICLFWDISCKLSHSMHGFLCLASFT